MIIPQQYSDRYLYHFTHLDNLESLLINGLLCKNHHDYPAVSATSIAAANIQERRATMEVPCGAGGVVHDYVPFYFGSLSPMLLAVINRKNIDQWDIVYLEFPIDILSRPGSVFTDAAANTAVPPNFYEDAKFLSRLNWLEIDSIKWKSSSEVRKQQRMAEALIPFSISVQEASRIVVWNKGIKRRVEEILARRQIKNISVEFESSARRHYFTKWQPPSDKGLSLITGPKGIADQYMRACAKVRALPSLRENAICKTPRVLLEMLRKDFACTSHTSELVGLKSENGLHKRTVDVHTLEVVSKLLTLPEFHALDQTSKDRVELAAYLHDIGKGPNARWAWNKGLQKVDADHPVRAMPMMVEIFEKYVEKAREETANVLLKLVCYHDLVGEVLGKGRDEKQITDVVNDELELRMLFAIGKADATALVETWWDQEEADALYQRCLDVIMDRNADCGG